MADHSLQSKILFIDDDSTVADSVAPLLSKYNIKIFKAMDLSTAIYLFNQQIFEVVIVELEFAPLYGLALIQKFRKSNNPQRRGATFIVIAGKQRTPSDNNLLKELGELEVIDKPIIPIKFLTSLTKALDRQSSTTKFEEIRTQVYDVWKKTNDINQAISTLKNNITGQELKGTKLMAELFEEARKYNDSLNIINALLARSPEDISLINTKARLLLKMGKAEEAKKYYEQADKSAPKNIERVEHMAKMYLELNDPESSVEKMKDIIDLNPEKKDLRFNLFDKLESAGHMDHAVNLCRDTTPPMEVVRYYNNKGVASSKQGDTQSALQEYTSALKFFPKFKENYRILFNIALAEANQNTKENLNNAKTAILKCIELNPNFDKAKKLLEAIENNLSKL